MNKRAFSLKINLKQQLVFAGKSTCDVSVDDDDVSTKLKIEARTWFHKSGTINSPIKLLVLSISMSHAVSFKMYLRKLASSKACWRLVLNFWPNIYLRKLSKNFLWTQSIEFFKIRKNPCLSEWEFRYAGKTIKCIYSWYLL